MPQLEKDPRVYFALERTFLAWIRTGLALMGFGFVVARFGIFLGEIRMTTGAVMTQTTGFSAWAGTALVLMGVAVQAVSMARYVHVVGQLNRGEDVTGMPSKTALTVSAMLALIGIGVAAYLIAIR
jgi:putative membrane protein